MIGTETTEDFLARMLARPMTHKVVTRFADGTTREHTVQSAGAAENYAFGERRKIGKVLKSRMTDQVIPTITAVTIEAL
jgi:hypothetical protein